jgi:hypothetical protein
VPTAFSVLTGKNGAVVMVSRGHVPGAHRLVITGNAR